MWSFVPLRAVPLRAVLARCLGALCRYAVPAAAPLQSPPRSPTTLSQSRGHERRPPIARGSAPCIVGTGFSPDSGLSSFVRFFTLSCRPPVTASITSEKPMSIRPRAESSAPFFFLPARLKTQTPTVMRTTWRYSNAEYRLPPSTMPPAITGTILHDLPSTCVGYET